MPVLTAVENVELPLLVARVPATEARRRAVEALELVGLPDRAPRAGGAVGRCAPARDDRARS
jgi:predicted ABC-type transport system involved in lysophospholipase L1 biosynthesis ATPase subunit